MSFWRVVLDVLRGHHERWNPRQDATLRYLRTQTSAANVETQRLRRMDPAEALRRARERRGQDR